MHLEFVRGPLVLVNDKNIPPVELDESFKYLGKEFNFKMSTEHKEKDLIHELTLFDIGGGGGHDGPQNIFDHCAQMLKRRKLRLGDF